jgi:hypothetical protein
MPQHPIWEEGDYRGWRVGGYNETASAARILTKAKGLAARIG